MERDRIGNFNVYTNEQMNDLFMMFKPDKVINWKDVLDGINKEPFPEWIDSYSIEEDELKK